MKDITIQSNSSEIFVLNLRDLLESFESITDPRAKRGKIYPLPFLLMCILLAKLSGQDTPTAIASWAKERKPELLHLKGQRREHIFLLHISQKKGLR